VLQNGISTRSAKAGDSVLSSDLLSDYPETTASSFRLGSYLRGELLEAKRPGRIKRPWRIFRMRLDTLILPTGYTVDLRAAPAQRRFRRQMRPWIRKAKVTGGRQ